MYLGLFIALLIGTSATFAYLFKKNFEETLPTTVLSMTLLMYGFAIMGALKVGFYATLGLGAVSVLACLYFLICDKSTFLKRIITPGLLMFGLFFVFTWWAHRGRHLSQWDEFSHWGLTVKNMFALDLLGNQSIATTTFKSYPPAIALFQYFLQKLSGVYIEANLYRSINLFNVALLIPIFKLVSWKRPKQFLMLAFIMMTIPLAFYYEFYHTIYVDATLGVLFGFILYTYFSSPLTKFSLLNLTLAFMALVLTKETGFGLAVIAFVIIIPDLIINRQKVKDFLMKNCWVNKVMFTLPLIGTIAAKYSWSFYLKLTQTESYWGEPGVTLQKVLDLYADDQPEYRKQTMLNFFNALFTDKITGFMIDINFIGCLFILAALGIFLVYLKKDKDRIRMKWAIRLTFTGCLIFAASLLSVYLFTYSEEEATGLASLARYLGTYLTGFFIFIMYLILQSGQHARPFIKKYLFAGGIAFILCFINVKPLINCTLLAPYYIDQTIEARKDYHKLERVLDVVDAKTEKVFIVAQNNKSGHLTARYVLTPIQTNTWYFSVGQTSHNAYTVNLEPESLLQMWREYDYVYLYRLDDQFKEQYGPLFGKNEILHNDTLYRIIQEDDTIKLEYVDLPY